MAFSAWYVIKGGNMLVDLGGKNVSAAGISRQSQQHEDNDAVFKGRKRYRDGRASSTGKQLQSARWEFWSGRGKPGDR